MAIGGRNDGRDRKMAFSTFSKLSEILFRQLPSSDIYVVSLHHRPRKKTNY